MCLLVGVYSLLNFCVHQKHWRQSVRTEVWQFQNHFIPLTSWHVHLWMFWWQILWSDVVNGPDLVVLYSWASLLGWLLFDLSVTMVFSQLQVALAGKVGWEALHFLFSVGRWVFTWQISWHTVSGSVPVSRCDDKHIWAMVSSWGVGSRCSKVGMSSVSCSGSQTSSESRALELGCCVTSKQPLCHHHLGELHLWAAWECASVVTHRVNVWVDISLSGYFILACRFCEGSKCIVCH